MTCDDNTGASQSLSSEDAANKQTDGLAHCNIQCQLGMHHVYGMLLGRICCFCMQVFPVKGGLQLLIHNALMVKAAYL